MVSAIQVASLYGVLSLRDNMTPGLRDAKRETDSFGSRLSAVGSQITDLSSRMTMLTAPIGAAMGYGIAQSNQFSRSMSNINAILQLSTGDASALRSELLAIGGNTVAGPQAVAEAYYEIASGVADASTHMSILDAAIATSEAGQADLTATTSAFISTMNSYGFAAEDASFVSDIFSRTVGMGVLSMDDLASALPQVTGLASQFDIGLDEAGGSLAYLTTQGFSASQSATFLKGMITTLLNPTADLGTAITGLGFSSGQAMLESEGLIGAYQLLASQGDGLAGLITNQEALTGSLVLTGDAAMGFMTDYQSGVDGATAAAGAVQDQTEGWDLLRSKIDTLAITAGDTLAPALLDLTDNYISPLIDKITDWTNKHPDLTTKIMLVTGALVILFPMIGLVGGAIGTLIAVALSPLGLALAVGAGLILAYQNNWLGFKDFIDGTIRPMLDQLAEDIRNINFMLGNPLGMESTLGQPREGGTWTHEGGGFGAQASIPAPEAGHGTNAGGGIWASSGGRASGGSVTAGRDYLVGERGPELFKPSSSGTIVSNQNMMAAAGGGGDMNITGPITIVTNDVDDFRRQLEERRRRRG